MQPRSEWTTWGLEHSSGKYLSFNSSVNYGISLISIHILVSKNILSYHNSWNDCQPWNWLPLDRLYIECNLEQSTLLAKTGSQAQTSQTSQLILLLIAYQLKLLWRGKFSLWLAQPKVGNTLVSAPLVTCFWHFRFIGYIIWKIKSFLPW